MILLAEIVIFAAQERWLVNDELEGSQRGGLSDSNPNRREKDRFLLQDGSEVWNYKNPKTVLTVGFVSLCILIGSATLIGYRAGRNGVIELVWETVPKVKFEDGGDSLRKIINDSGYKLNEHESKLNKNEAEHEKIWSAINARK